MNFVSVDAPIKLLRSRAVPYVLWLMLWAGLNTHLGLLDAGAAGPWFQQLRVFLPLAAGVFGVLLGCVSGGGLWPIPGPLGMISGYGLVGLIASLVLSPQPRIALYWGVSYAAVLPVLVLLMRSSDALGSLRRLIELNWLVTALVGFGSFVVAEHAAMQLGRMSLRDLTGLSPLAFDMPMVRQTGIGRYAAVLAIVALARVLRNPRRQWWCWGPVVAVTALIIGLIQARSAFIGLVVSAIVVVALSGRLRVLVIGCTGLILASAMPGSVLSSLVMRGNEGVGTVSLFLSGRPDIWRAGLELYRDSPLFGWGFHVDRLLLEWPYKNHLSNAVLQALAQAGLVGLTAFLAAWIKAWWMLLRTWVLDPAGGGLDRAFLIEVIGVLTFLSVRSVFESTGAFFGVDWLLLAPLFAYAQAAHRRPLPKAQPVALTPA